MSSNSQIAVTIGMSYGCYTALTKDYIFSEYSKDYTTFSNNHPTIAGLNNCLMYSCIGATVAKLLNYTKQDITDYIIIGSIMYYLHRKL